MIPKLIGRNVYNPLITNLPLGLGMEKALPSRHLLIRFLLPWMVLHCIVIAFLALGAAILTAHDRALLGWIALIGKSTSAM